MEQTVVREEWIMTNLPFRVMLDNDSQKLIPSLPVPVAFEYVGLCENGSAMLFKNHVESIYNNRSDSLYFFVYLNQTKIIDVILKCGINQLIWITESTIPDRELNEFGSYPIIHPSSGEIIEAYFIGGVFLGKAQPPEVDLHWSVTNICMAEYCALSENSKYKWINPLEIPFEPYKGD
jgi:hypothetical protein